MIGDPLAAGAVQVGVIDVAEATATEGADTDDGTVATRLLVLADHGPCPTALTAAARK